MQLQIYQEAKKFGKVYNMQVVCCYGGGSKWEQSKALENGAEIIVATPGRIIDLVKMKATNLTRVTFLVLDEADRMFDMGFGTYYITQPMHCFSSSSHVPQPHNRMVFQSPKSDRFAIT